MNDNTQLSVETHTQSRPIGKLNWEEEGAQKERFISSAGLTIGRSVENDLMIRDIEASRFHTKILPEKENLIVVDLDSTNGTFLNEAPVEGDHELKTGDRIRIGKLEFLVTIFTSEPSKETPLKEELPLDETLLMLPDTNIPRLVVEVGMGRGTEFALNKERVSIGRASSNKKWDIDLVDKSVSRPHAELVKNKNEWVLTDLKSANGTSVNGVRLTEPHVLADGDVISLGETTLIVHLNPGAT